MHEPLVEILVLPPAHWAGCTGAGTRAHEQLCLSVPGGLGRKEELGVAKSGSQAHTSTIRLPIKLPPNLGGAWLWSSVTPVDLLGPGLPPL